MGNDIDFPVLPGEVAVLCGGPGPEREVSLDSGREVHNAFTRLGLENRLVIVPEDDAVSFLEKLECGIAVMMLHGEFGEDGTAQEILEERGIPYTGSTPHACRLAMDKAASKEVFKSAGILTPKWAVAFSPATADAVVRSAGLRYPLFVKPNCGGSSVGVSPVKAPEELAGAVEKALAGGGPALIEEMAVGRELTGGWLDGRVLPFVEMEAAEAFYDYHAKYESEKTRYHCPANLDAEVMKKASGIMTRVAKLIGVRDLARIDFILTDRGPMVLEVNALPGFTRHSLLPLAAARAGIGIERLCLSLVAMAAERSFPRLRVLPASFGEEEEDESEIIDFHFVDWKRVGV